MMQKIQCTTCKITKLPSDFSKRIDGKGNGFYLKCKECKKKKSKEWRANNPKKAKEWRQKRTLKEKQDKFFKLKRNISARVRLILKSKKSNHSFFNYVSYSLEELKSHLESQFESWMNWSNWGKYNPKTWDDNDSSTWTWQLDHITPHSCFKYSSMKDEEFKKCWALENLRPLSSKENILDGATRKRHI